MSTPSTRILHRRQVFQVAVVVVSALAMTAPASAEPEVGITPVRDPVAATLWSLPQEKVPKGRLHYFRSNEWRQDLLAPHLDSLGGALMGVGSDQNYTMAAMAKSSWLLLVDFDPRMPIVHEIYRILVVASETPASLLARFDHDAEDQTIELLQTSDAPEPMRATLVSHFKKYRNAWFRYLRRVSRTTWEGHPFTWLSNRDLYRHVRDLHRAHRIWSFTGNLLGTTTVRAVARFARDQGITLRVVYFSNAEQFFAYEPEFQKNMRVLPTDDRTVVVRTVRHRYTPKAPKGRWHYVVHNFSDFLRRMDTGHYKKVFSFTADIMAAGKPYLGQHGLSYLNADVPMYMMRNNLKRRAKPMATP